MSDHFKPSQLKISTMTVISKIYDNKLDDINLDILSRIIPIYLEDDEQLTTKDGGLLSINYFSNLTNKFNIKQYQHYKKNPFFNQSTSVFSYYGCRNINTKIFNNGILQMTGIQSEYESKYVSKCIINILKQCVIKIYLNKCELPKTKVNNHFVMYFNYKMNQITFYRWNYLEMFKIIEDELKIKLFTGNDKYKTLFETFDKKWVPNNVISKFINLIDAVFKTYTTKLKIILEYKNQKEFQNSNKIDKENIDISIRTINSLLNYLGNIYKKLDTVHKIDNDIVGKMKDLYKAELEQITKEIELEDTNVLEFDFIKDSSKLDLTHTKIELINSDFCVNFIINNTKLFQLIKNKYNLFSSYEPNDYPGVKNKFCWNI